MTDLTRIKLYPCSPHIPLLNDDSIIILPFYQKKVFLAGVTAAKTKKKVDFKVETSSFNFHWKFFLFLNVLVLELSIADTTDENVSNQCENTFNESKQHKMETGGRWVQWFGCGS